ncbi:MAG: LysR substrate-binding domain-containing protein [Pseudomonadota bacterium]
MPFRRLPALTALRAFEAVARCESFKDAADELCVTPGALSQHVKKLEDDLGIALLIRHNRSIEVTDAGRDLLSGLTAAFVRIRDAVAATRMSVDSDCLIVGCPPPFATKWLVPRLGRFTAQYPDLNIRIAPDSEVSGPSGEAVDITIQLSDEQRSELRAEHLVTESFLPLMSPDFIKRHKLTCSADLTRAPLLGDACGSLYSGAPTWADWFAACGLDAPECSPVIDFGDRVDHAIDAAVSGVGVLLGPRVLAEKELADGRLVSPWGPEIVAESHYAVASSLRPRQRGKVDAFKDWLRSEFIPPQQPAAPFLRAVNA